MLLTSRPHGLHARPGQQGGGGGLAAQGDMCMRVATNLVDEAAEASLAGPPMLESELYVSCRRERSLQLTELWKIRAVPSTLFLSRRGCSGAVSGGARG